MKVDYECPKLTNIKQSLLIEQNFQICFYLDCCTCRGYKAKEMEKNSSYQKFLCKTTRIKQISKQ